MLYKYFYNLESGYSGKEEELQMFFKDNIRFKIDVLGQKIRFRFIDYITSWYPVRCIKDYLTGYVVIEMEDNSRINLWSEDLKDNYNTRYNIVLEDYRGILRISINEVYDVMLNNYNDLLIINDDIMVTKDLKFKYIVDHDSTLIDLIVNETYTDLDDYQRLINKLEKEFKK